MAELYSIGVNRISYCARRFALGKNVSAYMYSPALVKSNLLPFAEMGEGLYYLDYNFAEEGTYHGKFFENGVPSIAGVFRVKQLATPKDIKDFTITRVLTAPRNLELIAKSVSQYYRGQTATLVVMARYAGAPTGVEMFATVYYPNDEVWINEVAMIPLGETGLYSHSVLIPEDSPIGVYKVKYKAVKSIAAQELADAFTQVDGLPINWTVFDGTWNVISNVLKQTGTSYAHAHWKDALAVDWANYTFKYDIRADVNTTNFILGIKVRYKSSSLTYNFYYSKYRNMLCLDRGTVSIKEKAKTLVWNQWYNFKIDLVGATIKCYLDDALEIEWTDLNPIATGVPTLYCAGVSSFDNTLITIPAQEYQEFEISDFKVEDTPGLSPAQNTRLMETLTEDNFLGLK